jgi:hypothetical protein
MHLWPIYAKHFAGVVFGQRATGRHGLVQDGLWSWPVPVAYLQQRPNKPIGAFAEQFGGRMWNFQSKRNPLRDRMLLAAPESNPHEFVRRLLLSQRNRATSVNCTDTFKTDMRTGEAANIAIISPATPV